MKKLVWASLTVALLAAFAPVSVYAKGASEATIEGPGLDRPITMTGEGQVGGEALMRIAEEAGFFAAVFGQSPDPMLKSRPAGPLGPRYRVTYLMPGPNNELDAIVQEIYPFAAPDPVTYTKPGQRFWTTEQTRGGWFIATSTLTQDLIVAGVPASRTVVANLDGFSWVVARTVALLLTAVVAFATDANV